jgi:uncharacterized protein YcaQ
MTVPQLTTTAARRIAVSASLLAADETRPKSDAAAIINVVGHFGSLQIDPTRTVEKTHYLVLWSRLGGYDRAALDSVTYAERRLLEHNAFYVPIERLPELRYEANPWLDRWERVQKWLATNKAFHDSILEQLERRGPLQSRDIDDSMLVAGWESSGWTHGRNTTRMLEFMGKALEVMVSRRVGQERLWDLPDRVIPKDAPNDTLDDDAYTERKIELAMRRLGFADLRDLKQATYWAPKAAVAPAIERMVADGRLIPIISPYTGLKRSAWATPQALAADSDRGSRTTLLSPFDRLIYDRERTAALFGFEYKLEMYVPKAERKFGHFTLPVLHDNNLVGRLDSELDRKQNVFVVNKLHWEGEPAARVRREVDRAVDELAEFVGAKRVRRER